MSDEVDLAYRILDLDLVDCEGIRCGKVDDLELHGGPGEPTYVAAIISGRGALSERFPRRLRSLASRIFRGEVNAVAWREVEDVTSRIELANTAAELELGRGDRDPIFFDDRAERS